MKADKFQNEIFKENVKEESRKNIKKDYENIKYGLGAVKILAMEHSDNTKASCPL